MRDFDYDRHIVGTPAYLEPADDPEPPIGLMVWWSEDEDDVPEIGEVIKPSYFTHPFGDTTLLGYVVRFPRMGERLLDPSEWEVAKGQHVDVTIGDDNG
jgi:hypothetical protein